MKKRVAGLTLVLAAFLTAPAAEATPVSLPYGSAYYLGRVDDGVPSGDAQSAAYINFLITLADEAPPTAYNAEWIDRQNSTVSGPFPEAVYVTRDEGTTIDGVKYPPAATFDATGYSYILAKYGQNPSLVWFVDGALGEVEVPSSYVYPVTNTGGGLSHIALFNYEPRDVPDGGATLMLLGGALVGIGALRRKLGR